MNQFKKKMKLNSLYGQMVSALPDDMTLCASFVAKVKHCAQCSNYIKCLQNGGTISNLGKLAAYFKFSLLPEFEARLKDEFGNIRVSLNVGKASVSQEYLIIIIRVRVEVRTSIKSKSAYVDVYYDDNKETIFKKCQYMANKIYKGLAK